MERKTEASERWHDVKGYEGLYKVSSSGRVMSLQNRKGPNWILRTRPDTSGHLQVDLRRNGSARNYLVHRLVLEAFTGPCPAGLETAHLNGIPSDNRISNLIWTTRKENCRHKIIHGTILCGEKVWCARLSSSDVLEIRKLIKGKHFLIREIAARFGVARETIAGIKHGRTWKHLIA